MFNHAKVVPEEESEADRTAHWITLGDVSNGRGKTVETFLMINSEGTIARLSSLVRTRMVL